MSSRLQIAGSVLVVVLLASFATSGGTSAGDSSTDAIHYVANINELRRAEGLNGLAIDSPLAATSLEWSEEMSGEQSLEHDPDLVAAASGCWRKIGENVGVGPDTDRIWEAFVASPSHYENLVDPSFTHLGVAVVRDASGKQWTTHRFLSLPCEATPEPLLSAEAAPSQPTATVATAAAAVAALEGSRSGSTPAAGLQAGLPAGVPLLDPLNPASRAGNRERVESVLLALGVLR